MPSQVNREGCFVASAEAFLSMMVVCLNQTSGKIVPY